MGEWDPVDSPESEGWNPVAKSDDWTPVKTDEGWQPISHGSATLARVGAAAEMAYNLSPMGYINEHVVHPALTKAKEYIASKLPDEQSITPDFQSSNPLMHGLGYAKAATAAVGNTALSQVPESSLGLGVALGVGKGISAVGEYGPALVGKAFPAVGEALGTDVGGWAVKKIGTFADWLDKKADGAPDALADPATAPRPTPPVEPVAAVPQPPPAEPPTVPPTEPPAAPPEQPPTGPLYPESDYQSDPEWTKVDEAQRLLSDRMQAIKYKSGQEMDARYANAGGEYTDAYGQVRTMPGRIMSQGKDVVDAIETIKKPLRNASDQADFSDLYALKNHQDMADAGAMTSGITAEEAQGRIDAMKQRLGPETFKRIDDVVENVAKYNNDKGLGLLVDSGKLTPEAAEQWRTRFPHYMPSEILDDQLMNNGQPSALGKIKQNFMKRKSGTDALINEDADQMIKKGLLNKISAVEKQRAVDQIAQQFGKFIGQERRVGSSVVKTYDADSQIPEGYVESSVRTSDGKIIAVSKQVNDLLEGLNTFQKDIATKAMMHYNAVFREGATAMRLTFSAGHFIRAAESALMNTRPAEGATHGLRPLASAILSAAKDMVGLPDADMHAFRAAGGAFGGIADPRHFPLPFRLQSLGQKALSVAAIPFKIPARMGRFSDNVIRLNEFNRLKPSDMPEVLKALNARDISIDFEKSGDLVKHINQWIPFINDKIQANVNTMRMFRDNPAVATGRTAAYILAPTMGLYYWNHKFANDDQVDPYIRENYFYINTGKTTINNGIEVPVVFTVPKKGIYQYLSNVTTAMLDFKFNKGQYRQDVKGYRDPSRIALGVASEVAPPALKLVAEPALNKSFYTGQPLVSEAQQNLDPHLQANSASSNTARYIANKTGVPAQYVENMANNAFPAAHQFTNVTDALMKRAGVQPVNPQPEKAALQRSQGLQPFVRAASGFYSTEEANQNDILAKLKQQVGTPRYMAKQALYQYEQNRTPAGLAEVNKWMGQLSGADRERIIKNVYANLRLKQVSPADRAIGRTPNKYKQQVYQGLQE